MGGIGSGRRYQGGKVTTSNMHPLDIRRLHRKGLLSPGADFSWHWTVNDREVSAIRIHTEVDRVILIYRTRDRGGEWQPMEYPVYLAWTPCNLGGRRAWFLCPARGCGRRVAIIYGGSIFACRHCHQLAYESQRETDDDRAARRADTVRRRLGWEPGILNGSGGKPKGMHWRTFDRLKTRHDAYVGVSLAGMAKRLGLIGRQLDDIRADMDGWG